MVTLHDFMIMMNPKSVGYSDFFELFKELVHFNYSIDFEHDRSFNISFLLHMFAEFLIVEIVTFLNVLENFQQLSFFLTFFLARFQSFKQLELAQLGRYETVNTRS